MRTRTWPKKKLWLFSIVSILLVLVVLEVIFRIVFAIEYRHYNTSVYIQGNSLQMSDDTLIFRNRPFYLDHDLRYQFNEEGMRVLAGQDTMPEKKQGDFWVFVFGGSAIEGMGSNKDGEWLDITGVTDHAPAETIAGLLEKKLQSEMSGRRVKVFNAANSGFTLWQGMERYKQLSRKYEIDFVVSMDGENEPAALKAGETPRTYVTDRWKENPVFKFPLNVVIPLTSHSAFINQVKQFLFHYRINNRLRQNEQDSFPARKRWAGEPLGTMQFAEAKADHQRALDVFYLQVAQFDSLLTANRHPHLLYIQPHIAFRDTARMNLTERALYNYYAATYNDPVHNAFKARIYKMPERLPASGRLMTGLHAWDQQLFVDYCHFTRQGNEYIAEMIAKDILASVQRQ